MRERKKIKWINSFLIFISVISIAGWVKFEEYKILWSTVLVSVQAARILRNTLFVSESELYNVKNSIFFYSYHIPELESLYYDYHEAEFKETTIKKRFNELKEKERQLFTQQKVERIPSNERLILLAEKQTDQYLMKIINNLSNE